jgi:hypothetical protein
VHLAGDEERWNTKQPGYTVEQMTGRSKKLPVFLWTAQLQMCEGGKFARITQSYPEIE